MSKINLDNIKKQMARAEAEYEDAVVNSRPMSLSVHEIVLNPDNTAAQHDDAESIAALASSIQASGLIHPLTVNKIGEHQYMLLSGERRFKAITQHLGWEQIPCTVYNNLIPSMAAVVTIEANMQTREYSVADRLTLYQQLDAALRDLKEKGVFKGGIGREIAKMMGVSEQQIGKYKRLVTQLSPEEIQQVTNINQAVKQTRTPTKAETEVQFFEKAPPLKTETQFQFLEQEPTRGEARNDVRTALRCVSHLLRWATEENLADEQKQALKIAHAKLLTFQFDTGLNKEQ